METKMSVYLFVFILIGTIILIAIIVYFFLDKKKKKRTNSNENDLSSGSQNYLIYYSSKEEAVIQISRKINFPEEIKTILELFDTVSNLEEKLKLKTNFTDKINSHECLSYIKHASVADTILLLEAIIKSETKDKIDLDVFNAICQKFDIFDKNFAFRKDASLLLKCKNYVANPTFFNEKVLKDYKNDDKEMFEHKLENFKIKKYYQLKVIYDFIENEKTENFIKMVEDLEYFY
ncbi:hypothetical protein MHBO_001953 [Bonamia ostreae]|uniref:Uncharacterized protein n=1 Tax=Bonamia ostreae TaxID=126728 RepID=A0ABV2ALD0_9EUKA